MYWNLKQTRFFLIILLWACAAKAQDNPLITKDYAAQQQWVDQQYKGMTLEERIGQLFMVMVSSGEEAEATAQAKEWIRDYAIGGVVFSVGGPKRQARITNTLQENSRIPLLVALDAEWGLAMRLDSTYAFPWNTTLGAIQDTTVLEQIGYQIGLHAKRIGVHLNFAPVADVNINPKNPIIGNRSFGADPNLVGNHARLLMQGMHRAGLLTSAKHFPGHGDTATDSHHALPVIPFSRKRLDTVELRPFKNLIEAGLPTIMIAHLDVPALTGNSGKPTSLSEVLIQQVLHKQMKFRGLVVTDALNMKGFTSNKSGKNATLSAFLAGNDLLLMPKDLKSDRAAFLSAYKNGTITESRLARSVKKILEAKYKAGLNQYVPVELNHLEPELNTSADDLVYERAMEEAITVLRNTNDLLGLKSLDTLKIGYLKLGSADHNKFLNRLQDYASVSEIDTLTGDHWTEKLTKFNLIIAGVHMSNATPWKVHKLSDSDRIKLKVLSDLPKVKTVLTLFANPYMLPDIPYLENFDAVVQAYQNSGISQETAAEVLFGALPAKGKLPVSALPAFPIGAGIELPSLRRLGFSIPERVQMDSKKLKGIDTLVQRGLDSLYFPGAQVLVARHGQIIYHKAFGTTTYQDGQEITLNHIYDLASLTKILATLPVLMSMEENRELDLTDTFATLNPAYAETALKDVTVLRALSHYGRLPAWIPFYLNTLGPDHRPDAEYYRNGPSENFPIQVADRLYLLESYGDSIYNRIGKQTLKSNRYRYSDLAYYVFKQYIEKVRENSLDLIVDSFLLKPIGANRTTFNPLKKMRKEEIVPSEIDEYFRYQELQGYVHDMGAAMQGGIGGHAGLFSNANDVAKIMQMYLQGGYYGGKRYLDVRTIEKFNRCYFCNDHVRRGVGFDKPDLTPRGPTCNCVSKRSFGHSGFTGTYAWADPASSILYVFLSNRTYPSATNNLLIRSQLRTRIQKVIYDSIKF
jgi:beta-glucosidase-like glycosyl hydrolase/CubicO group peptidase (beta-lactamase class C family)